MSKVYQIVTDRIIAKLEAGTVPWRRPWRTTDGAPRNLASKREYRGINIWMLAAEGYASPWWATFPQVRAAGGTVRKGERSTPVVFWLPQRDDEDTASRRPPILRFYSVFNALQCDGLDLAPADPHDPPPPPPNEACARVLAGFRDPPTIRAGSAAAWYRPATDTVGVPPAEAFDDPPEYWSTLFHELTHSTGHASRLARKAILDGAAFRSHAYSEEELCAEMGAAYLCAHCGIEATTLDNSAAYIANWLKRLKSDPRLVIQAGAQAQRAVDLVLGAAPAHPERPAAAAATDDWRQPALPGFEGASP